MLDLNYSFKLKLKNQEVKKWELEVYGGIFKAVNQSKVRISESAGILMSQGSREGLFPSF